MKTIPEKINCTIEGMEETKAAAVRVLEACESLECALKALDACEIKLVVAPLNQN